MLWGGSKGLVGPRIEAARHLMEAPHLRGMEEEGDQTREGDWGKNRGNTQRKTMMLGP